MKTKQFNPLADIAGILAGFAQLLPNIPTPSLPKQANFSDIDVSDILVTSPHVPKQADVSDILVTNQLKGYQKEQAEKGLVVFKYE